MKRLAIPLLVVALAGCSYRGDIDLERDKQGWPVFFIHSDVDLGNITISMTPMRNRNGKPLWQFHNDNRVKELRLPYSTVGDFRTLPAGCYVVYINGPGMLGYSNFYVARDHNVVTMRKIGLTHLPADMQSDEDKEAVRLCDQPPKHR